MLTSVFLFVMGYPVELAVLLVLLAAFVHRWRKLNRIERKVDQIMGQLEDLQAALKQISDDVDAVATEVADLIAKLTTTPVDLTGAIAQAQAIHEKLKAIPPEPA